MKPLNNAHFRSFDHGSYQKDKSLILQTFLASTPSCKVVHCPEITYVARPAEYFTRRCRLFQRVSYRGDSSKNLGPLFGSPCNEDHSILGSTLEPPFLETAMEPAAW